MSGLREVREVSRKDQENLDLVTRDIRSHALNIGQFCNPLEGSAAHFRSISLLAQLRNIRRQHEGTRCICDATLYG